MTSTTSTEDETNTTQEASGRYFPNVSNFFLSKTLSISKTLFDPEFNSFDLSLLETVLDGPSSLDQPTDATLSRKQLPAPNERDTSDLSLFTSPDYQTESPSLYSDSNVEELLSHDHSSEREPAKPYSTAEKFGLIACISGACTPTADYSSSETLKLGKTLPKTFICQKRNFTRFLTLRVRPRRRTSANKRAPGFKAHPGGSKTITPTRSLLTANKPSTRRKIAFL